LSDAVSRRTGQTGAVSDDWLQHGHEMDGVELTPVLSSSGALDGRAAAPSTPRWTSGWRGLIVGGAIALLATLGIVGVANAISDNLFPSMGSARPSSVWLNPVPPTEPAATTTPTSTTPTSATSTTTATAPATVPPATAATAPNTANTTALVPSTSASTGEDDDRGGNGGDDEPDEPDDSDSSGRSSSGSGRDDDRDDSDVRDDNDED
jgi:hypothetical protein